MTLTTDIMTLSWMWIGIAASAPILAALIIALPIWLMRQSLIGNVVGTVIILTAAMLLITREYFELIRRQEAAQAAGRIFRSRPDEFTRFAIYAGIGFAEVFALFMLGLLLEERLRRRDRSRAWR